MWCWGEQGIFFVAGDSSATRASMVMQNKPAHLMFMVPTLAAGDYALEVRVQMSTSGAPRVGRLNQVLTVT